MSDEFFYKIVGFSPREDMCTGGYGFCVLLDKNLAKKALETELFEKGYNNLETIATSTIKGVGLAKKDERIKPPYHFVRNEDGKLTWLLQFCTVPGDACDLGLEWGEINGLKGEHFYKDYIDYTPHNVDHVRQAYSLLSIWLFWAEIVESISRSKS